MPVAVMGNAVVVVVRTGRGGARGRQDAKNDSGGDNALH
jgi:hypothetical protein